jgi:hypothetical protein
MILIIILLLLLNSIQSQISSINDIIKLNTNEFTNIELKSIFDLHSKSEETIRNNEDDDDDDVDIKKSNKQQKERLFWSFKRIYFNSTLLNNNNDLMIALDNEVEENLKKKYSIVDNYNYNLLIKNLTFMDSGYYICNIWNQKKLVYELIVNSKFSLSLSLLFLINFYSLGQPSKPLINLFKKDEDEELVVVSGRQINYGIKEFENIYLKCTTKHGYPFPDIKWFKNNIEM